MIQTQTLDYDRFVFNEIRSDIKNSLNFINTYCKEKDITSIKKYFWYKTNESQIYPDSLDHLFKGKISVYYLACNRSFIEYYHHLHDDIRHDLNMSLSINNKQEIIKQNKYLKLYLQKILNNNFMF
jgi:hypothetical protein